MYRFGQNLLQIANCVMSQDPKLATIWLIFFYFFFNEDMRI